MPERAASPWQDVRSLVILSAAKDLADEWEVANPIEIAHPQGRMLHFVQHDKKEIARFVKSLLTCLPKLR